MHCGRVFFTQSSRGELRFECGASWEVDLRSDADCASSSLGRCHPRYTLGSAAREVSLFRGERQLPHRAEYAHAFCDAWGSGRIENVHLAPSQRDEAQQRSAAHHAACLLLTRHALHRCARALRLRAALEPPPPPPPPPPPGPDECYRGSGADYAGTVATTRTGRQCQQWASDWPHQHRWQDLPANHCRNPDADTAPWCYTTDPAVRDP